MNFLLYNLILKLALFRTKYFFFRFLIDKDPRTACGHYVRVALIVYCEKKKFTTYLTNLQQFLLHILNHFSKTTSCSLRIR